MKVFDSFAVVTMSPICAFDSGYTKPADRRLICDVATADCFATGVNQLRAL